MDIILQNETDAQDVEVLLDLAFGPNRHEKPAYAYRENVPAIKELSFVIYEDGHIIATLRFWPVKIGGKDCLLLGPIAVLPNLQGKGYGIALMKHGLAKAKELGHTRVILVGDEPYYSRVGFSRDIARNITIKGQKDESRILAHELLNGSFRNVFGEMTKV
jgi:predicted N-acetyltransferase YhbS